MGARSLLVCQIHVSIGFGFSMQKKSFRARFRSLRPNSSEKKKKTTHNHVLFKPVPYRWWRSTATTQLLRVPRVRGTRGEGIRAKSLLSFFSALPKIKPHRGRYGNYERRRKKKGGPSGTNEASHTTSTTSPEFDGAA